jgi:carbonic anhydrase
MSNTPNEVLNLLKNRYSSYKDGTSKPRETPRPCGPTQSPIAAILTCIDSRVSVDDIFDNSDNSLMIARVAGNITSPEISASLEYAVAVAGCKVIMVLGHTHCGAVASAIANADITENIITLLSHIDTKGSTDAEAVTISNIKDTCIALKSNTLLSEIIAKGELEIVGALYDVESCELTFF